MPESSTLAFEVSQYGGYADLKYEPPVLPGSYLAVRVEQLAFPDFEDPRPENGKRAWDQDITRLSGAIGYKLSRMVLLKASYADQFFTSAEEAYDDYAFRLMMTIMF